MTSLLTNQIKAQCLTTRNELHHVVIFRSSHMIHQPTNISEQISTFYWGLASLLDVESLPTNQIEARYRLHRAYMAIIPSHSTDRPNLKSTFYLGVIFPCSWSDWVIDSLEQVLV